MDCPSCGREAPVGAAFCKHCGTRLTPVGADTAEERGQWSVQGQPASGPRAPAQEPPSEAPWAQPSGAQPDRAWWPPEGQPSSTPPAVWPEPPPPPSNGGGRRLLIAAIVVVSILLVLLVASMAAVVLLRDGEERGDGGTPTVSLTPATTSPEQPSSTNAGSNPPAPTEPDPASPGDDYAGGAWVEMDLNDAPRDAFYVVVSDDAVAFEREDSIVVLEFASGRTYDMPTELENVGMVDIDGPQVVWWEGTYDEDLEEWAEEGIFAYRLPTGPRVQLAGKEGSPGFPLVSGGFVTWTQARPSTFSPEEVWEFPILGVDIAADGSQTGSAELLVPAPTAFVLGDSVWSYDLSPTHLAWEHHWDTTDGDAGTYVRDLRTGAEIYLGSDSWRPALAGASVAYWGRDGLFLRDLASGDERLLDPDGDWPALTQTYVAYLRSTQDADSFGWEIVTRGLKDGSEEVLGVQTTPPWFGSTVSVSPHHLAYVDGENRPHVFERRR